MNKVKNTVLFILTLSFLAAFPVFAQNNQAASELKTIRINADKNDIGGVYLWGGSYYTFHYRDTKPDDVPQEVYDALWEVQKEVADNFTYDYDVLYGRRRVPVLETLEDFYRYGKGVCDNYANFFILLAREKGCRKRYNGAPL